MISKEVRTCCARVGTKGEFVMEHLSSAALAAMAATRHRVTARPPFECIALLLQGGGALGAYQAGVYQALSEAGLEPDWVAGISIGAINAAIIAGNSPAERLQKLREFWESITQTALPYSPAAFESL